LKQRKTRLIEIGLLKSCFQEKFGIPKQSGLIPSAKGYIHFHKEFSHEDYFRGLESFSHVWLIFKFHKNGNKKSPVVRPPILGGNKKLGIFATRSPYRPSQLGLSWAKIERLEITDQKTRLYLSGLDILNNSPIYDIKPYIPDHDSIKDANSGWLDSLPIKTKRPVKFSDEAKDFLKNSSVSGYSYEELIMLITEILELDPRPSYKPRNDPKEYRFKLLNFDVVWSISNEKIWVKKLLPLTI
jgi:tRNA (adenine37-N6)-methyltransferase